MSKKYKLFEVFGLETEYMIVDKETLKARPICDSLLRNLAGEEAEEGISEVELGSVTVSNELVNHLLEFKVTSPVADIYQAQEDIAKNVKLANKHLSKENACLMPTGMHPWMSPLHEAMLWPGEGKEIYQQFDRIFSCRTHGWANLQSVHLNLPFNGEKEFRLLHSAIRLVLPLIPALAASSPYIEGVRSGLLDTRLDIYRFHTQRIPSMVARVIPEVVSGEEEYRQRILEPIYRDVRPLDTEGILQSEWLNARGAIARFQRSAIEIRLIDAQECPLADGAICWFVSRIVKRLTEQHQAKVERLETIELHTLENLLLGASLNGAHTLIEDREYLRIFGFLSSSSSSGASSIGELLEFLYQETALAEDKDEFGEVISTILGEGCLSQRIIRRVSPRHSVEDLRLIYRELCYALAGNKMFRGA